MNKNYNNGRSREYRIMDKLKLGKYDIIMRTRGSHSPIDIIAISKKNKQIRFIQSKPKKFGNKATERLLKKYSWLNKNFKCSFEVMSVLKIKLPIKNSKRRKN